MEKTYNFKDFEDKITELWIKSGIGCSTNAQESKDEIQKQPFVLVIPPPNVTGTLHMGHGLDNTIQDTIVRYKRMKGHCTTWVPGTDHAGIATQQVMERTLIKEGKNRADFSREAFVEKTMEFALEHKKIILNQLRKIGASCDWDKERFTLDEGMSQAVCEAFVTLYERGLIYRGDYLVNWSVGIGTALSDDEVEYKEVQGSLYTIRYPLVNDDKQRFIDIATTRPETMLGDVAVAVHPDDERYTHYIGSDVQLPLTNRSIPILADKYVKSEFGTGAVKITPAHDHNDYELGMRHKLQRISILNTDGTINENAPEQYRGLSVEQARRQVVDDLKEKGYLINIKPHTHSVGHCYRTGTVVEPMLSTQWFVKMKSLAQKALQAWENGEVTFHPKHWENTFVHWLRNIKDWCISRQLLWGHRIPVWYDDATGDVIVSREKPQENGHTLRQESDVLDTWFSSWLWPFSVFGWPNITEDLKKFYPTSVLITGYDILFFWVARMIMAGLEFVGKVPFHDVYMHGLIRDEKGKKMSKSLGNGIDPLTVIDTYGSDAMRFTLTFLCKLDTDILLREDNFHLGSRFANKIWNASRFVLMNVQNISLDYEIVHAQQLSNDVLTSIDRWIVSRLHTTCACVEKMMKAYRLDEAAKYVYEYFWFDFCDWYVEASKVFMASENTHDKTRSASVLVYLLQTNLKLLHPFLPFVTEQIYQNIYSLIGEHEKTKNFHTSPVLALASYPHYQYKMIFEEEVKMFSALQELVTEVRTLRSEFTIAPKKIIHFSLIAEHCKLKQYFAEQKTLIEFFTHSELSITDKHAEHGIGISGSEFSASVFIKESIDVEVEKSRLTKRKEKLMKQHVNLCTQLANEKFIEKASAEYIQQVKEQTQELQKNIEKTQQFYELL